MITILLLFYSFDLIQIIQFKMTARKTPWQRAEREATDYKGGDKERLDIFAIINFLF